MPSILLLLRILLRIGSRAVPGTRYLARTQLRLLYPLHPCTRGPVFQLVGMPSHYTPACGHRGLRESAPLRSLWECPHLTSVKLTGPWIGLDLRCLSALLYGALRVARLAS